ncbi:hypothetical protein Tco_1303595 [Tanacetum coccineum]
MASRSNTRSTLYTGNDRNRIWAASVIGIFLRRRRTGIMIFLELMASESFKGATNIERNGIKGSDLMVFSFATIVAATINLQEIDQLSMILSTISDASRLRTSGKILSDMGIVKTKHGYFLLFLAQS